MRTNPVAVSFDMRAPDSGTPTAELYAAALEMAAFADEIGVDRIGLMEHHGSEDGYLPQPFTLAAGMAAVTKKIRFSLGAVILPLHDPVMIAEQIAITDLMSNGRINVILAAGYVPSEFAMFGKSLKDRAKLMDGGLETILRALHGERFEVNGRPIFVRPLPVQEPEDIIMVGGGVAASARRAAQFGVGFGPMKPGLVEIYLSECDRLGHRPREYFDPKPGMPLSIHLCEDPEDGWAAIERHAVHVVTEYAKWADQEGEGSNSPFRGLTNPAVLRGSGLFVAWTPEQLLAKIPELHDQQTIGLQPLLGGLSPEAGWKSMELLRQTMPAIRTATAAAEAGLA